MPYSDISFVQRQRSQDEFLERDLECRDQSRHRHDHAQWKACRPHCANQAEESTRFNKPSAARRTRARARGRSARRSYTHLRFSLQGESPLPLLNKVEAKDPRQGKVGECATDAAGDQRQRVPDENLHCLEQAVACVNELRTESASPLPLRISAFRSVLEMSGVRAR